MEMDVDWITIGQMLSRTQRMAIAHDGETGQERQSLERECAIDLAGRSKRAGGRSGVKERAGVRVGDVVRSMKRRWSCMGTHHLVGIVSLGVRREESSASKAEKQTEVDFAVPRSRGLSNSRLVASTNQRRVGENLDPGPLAPI